MLNKLPLLIIVLVIVFLIASVISFIAVENAVTSEGVGKSDNSDAQIDLNKPPKTESAMVAIDIVKPTQE